MNNATTTSVSSVLNDLIECCMDGTLGYRHAAEHVKSVRLQQLFLRLVEQREQFSNKLETLVRSLSEKAEESGSISSAMHRGWMDLKAAISSNDEKAVLAECERGEDVAVAAYEKALETELPVDIRSAVVAQSAEVKASHDEIRALRKNTG
jgi:uncharacterized protein (TIGR02284 family)